jgi:hypothetical protein
MFVPVEVLINNPLIFYKMISKNSEGLIVYKDAKKSLKSCKTFICRQEAENNLILGVLGEMQI